VLLVAMAMARSCAPAPAPEATAPLAPPPPPPVPAAASVVVVEALSAVPQVAVDELPRERRKKPAEARPGAAKPARKDDPFARRR
jgi:hypothetical protein